ncbi:MAG: leucine-rich repeat domain-containing protein [Clostridia bacterium]|nr:leucine-rich repeat domain-containing protein [Clostridia bacterium]
MKGLIRRVAALALVLVMTVQPAAALYIDGVYFCPCLGRYSYFFKDLPVLLEVIEMEEPSKLSKTNYPDIYRQMYSVITEVFGDMVINTDDYSPVERYYAAWTYIHHTVKEDSTIWYKDIPIFARPMLGKSGGNLGCVLSQYAILRALDLDMLTDFRGDPIRGCVIIGGVNYLSYPEKIDDELFLVNSADWPWGFSGDWFVTEEPTISYSEYTPDTEIEDGYVFIKGTGILIDYEGTDTELVFPERTRMIKSGLFENNGNIRKAVFNEGLIDIGRRAFAGCTALAEIELPEGLMSIGEAAFAGVGIKELYIPGTVISGDKAFMETTVEKVTFGLGSQRVYPYMFDSCDQLADLRLPDSIWHIGEYAFRGCTALKELDMSENSCDIGRAAFKNSGLVSVKLPKLTVLQPQAFSFCSELCDVEMQEGLAYITDTFAGCLALGQVTIPSSVVAIHVNAFIDSNLNVSSDLSFVCGAESTASRYAETYDLPYTVDENMETFFKPLIKDGIFGGGVQYSIDHVNRCAVLYASSDEDIEKDDEGRLILPDFIRYEKNLYPVVEISDEALDDTTFSGIRLPVMLKTIGKNAFAGSDITKIDFSDCPFLEKLDGSTFMYCDKLEHIELGDHIKTIGEKAFYACFALKEFRSGSGLDTIGVDAFGESGLERVYLGENVKKIESGAFANLLGDSINSRCAIYFEGNAPELAENAFGSVPGAVMILRRPEGDGFGSEEYSEYSTGTYTDGGTVSLLDEIKIYEPETNGKRHVYIEAFHREKTEEYRAYVAFYDENDRMLGTSVAYLYSARAYVKGSVQKTMTIPEGSAFMEVFLTRYIDGSESPVTCSMLYDIREAMAQ